MDTTHLYRMLVRLLGYFVSMVMICISSQVFANPFYGSVSAISGVSDNAFKSQSDDDAINERQDQYALNVGADWANSLLAFNMGYDATKQTFAEDSQEGKNYLNGNSSLLIGKSTHPATLFLEHSRTTLLNSPDSVNLTQNLDEKDVFSAKPTLRQRLTPVDNVLLNGEYTRINYLENEFKNSRREGGSLVLDHKFSALDNVQLSIQQTSIDFEYSPAANYTYRSAALSYNVKLRKLSYSLKAGTNKTSPDFGKEYSSPSYGVDVKFDSGGQILSLNANRELTDTSSGGGNVLPKTELPTSDGASGNNLDQLDRTAYGISWSTSAVCQNCSFEVGATQRNDDYININQSAKERSWNAGISYALSRAAKISLHVVGGDYAYSQTAIGNDYKLQSTRIEYAYNINKDFDFNLLLRKEKRYGDTATQLYTESYAGAGLSYKF